MKISIYLCALLLISMSCHREDSCAVDCDTLPLTTCEIMDPEQGKVLLTIIEYFSPLQVLIIQQTPTSPFGLGFDARSNTCDSLVSPELVSKLDSILREESHWCSELIPSNMMITDDEVSCYYNMSDEQDQFCFLEKYKARKFLRVSPAAIIGDFAFACMIDSDCISESILLSKESGRWGIVCIHPGPIC